MQNHEDTAPNLLKHQCPFINRHPRHQPHHRRILPFWRRIPYPCWASEHFEQHQSIVPDVNHLRAIAYSLVLVLVLRALAYDLWALARARPEHIRWSKLAKAMIFTESAVGAAKVDELNAARGGKHDIVGLDVMMVPSEFVETVDSDEL